MMSTFDDCALYHQTVSTFDDYKTVSTFDNYALYHQTMTLNGFWYRWGLNPKFFIFHVGGDFTQNFLFNHQRLY